MNLTEIDGKIGIWLVLAIVASVVAVIYVLKSIFKKTATEDLASKYKDKKWDSPMEGTYKYPDVDVFGMSGPIFRYGLAAALALSVIGLNWTSYDKKVIIPTGALAFDDEIQVEVPRTAEPPPPPPPPPPPVVQEIKVTEEKSEEKVEFVDQSIHRKKL
jgi:protein TonB